MNGWETPSVRKRPPGNGREGGEKHPAGVVSLFLTLN